jgi:hypothetical protein
VDTIEARIKNRYSSQKEKARTPSDWPLQQLTFARTSRAAWIIKMTVASLEEQRRLVATLESSLGRSQSNLSGLETRLVAKQADRVSYADLVNRAKEIESTHKEWQKARKELEEWDKSASQFHEHQKERTPLLRRSPLNEHDSNG